jgi:hypothetical protein
MTKTAFDSIQFNTWQIFWKLLFISIADVAKWRYFHLHAITNTCGGPFVGIPQSNWF